MALLIERGFFYALIMPEQHFKQYDLPGISSV